MCLERQKAAKPSTCGDVFSVAQKSTRSRRTNEGEQNWRTGPELSVEAIGLARSFEGDGHNFWVQKHTSHYFAAHKCL